MCAHAESAAEKDADKHERSEIGVSAQKRKRKKKGRTGGNSKFKRGGNKMPQREHSSSLRGFGRELESSNFQAVARGSLRMKGGAGRIVSVES